MPEAVIVATARSPIGRAGKGSLTSIRPDDLAAQMVSAALAKVPQLDPADIDDLMLGCGLPGGEQGFNMARVVAVLLGYDHLPGTTVNRYCSSSLQTTRMAFHAIKAGEGDVFVSAGVECVSRFAKGSSDSWPDTKNPVFAEAEAADRTDRGRRASGTWHDPREDGHVPDIYIAMGQTAENVAGLRGISREQQDEFGVRSQNLAEKAIANGFWQREITPVTLPDGSVVSADDGPRPGYHDGEGRRAQAGVPPGRHGHRGQLLPAQRRGGGGRGDERRQGGRARHHAAGADRVHRGDGAVPGDHGPGPGRGVPAGAGPGRDDHRRHRPGGDQRGVRRPGHPVVHASSGIDLDKLNVNGGAIAVGHPFGMTGARITTTLLNSLQFHDATLGLETMCVGGGQGMAMIFERLS